jgi:hypothetical protein
MVAEETGDSAANCIAKRMTIVSARLILFEGEEVGVKPAEVW